MPNQMTITMDEAIQLVVARLKGPILVDEVAQQVLDLWPSKAKNPVTTIRQALHDSHAGRTIIFLTDQLVTPIQIALQGVSFRVTLTRQEADRGILLVYPAFTYFLPNYVSPESIQLVDAGGQPLPTSVIKLKQTQQTIFGAQTYENPAFQLSQWYKAKGIKRDDSLLITIEDWEAKRFRLDHEPARIRKKRLAEIQRRNQELADLLFEMLEAARSETIWGPQSVLTAYARLSDPTGYPGDHWLEVIEKDGRMQWNGSDIRYAEAPASALDRILGLDAPKVKRTSISREQARQVHQFKAAFKYRPDLWRSIQLQGSHTLADFDSELRNAFKHDPGDHLSGFWKLIRCGQSRRFREVRLGDVDPFGGGDAAELKIAELDLKPGEQLKYVYDFGDWIEHRLTLEAITEPEPGISYPRLAAQNKPRHQYCRHCQEQGRKTVATWVCIECSNNQQEDVLVCEKCLNTYHEEHYAEKMVY